MCYMHDYHVRVENGVVLDYPHTKYEECKLCGHRVRWKKDSKGRVDNKKYLKAHRRDFLQREGPTAKDFYRVWHPEEYEANKHKWQIKL